MHRVCGAQFHPHADFTCTRPPHSDEDHEDHEREAPATMTWTESTRQTHFAPGYADREQTPADRRAEAFRASQDDAHSVDMRQVQQHEIDEWTQTFATPRKSRAVGR